MKRPPVFVSVIVPTYKREAMLRETLESALALQYPRFEIIVYDQTPSHDAETKEYLKEFAKRENCFVYHDTTASLPRARNAAFLRARGEIILFIDDDVLLPKDFIQRHLKPYENEQIAAVSGRIIYPGEDANESRPLPVSEEKARHRIDLQIMRHTTPVRNPLHIGGGNFSVRRCWMERNGGFSNIMGGSALGEDVEFSGRLRRLGGIIQYEPDAWLIHRVDPMGGCRVDDASVFSRQRDRMRNLYYAIFHGAGWKRGAAIWKQRIRNRVAGSNAPSTNNKEASNRSFTSKAASAAGRFAGATEGILKSIANVGRWGDLWKLKKPAIEINSLPVVSVVIATLNRERVLCETIESLLIQEYEKFEIIVVDQTENHENETGKFLSRHDAEGKIRWIRESIKSVSRARNIGAFHARGDVLLFVDDDVTAFPGLVDSHALHYLNPMNWCMGGRVIRSREDPKKSNSFPRDKSPRAFEAPVCYHTTPFEDVLHVITCNLSMRRDVFVMIGGFDEWYKDYGEDMDLIGRMRHAGGRAAYNPDAALIHHVAPTGGTRIPRKDPYQVGRTRGVYHHYSILRVVGFSGWVGVTLGRMTGQISRFIARLQGKKRGNIRGPVDDLMAEGSGGAAAAVIYKAKQAAGSSVAFFEAFRLYLFRSKKYGDYFQTAKEQNRARLIGGHDPTQEK